MDKEFKWKSVSLKGKIAYIVSEGDRNYITMYYDNEKKEIDWLNSKTRSILFLFEFDKPEAIMNLSKGQRIAVDAVYDYSHQSNDYDDQTYFFNFFHPIIKPGNESNN